MNLTPVSLTSLLALWFMGRVSTDWFAAIVLCVAAVAACVRIVMEWRRA